MYVTANTLFVQELLKSTKFNAYPFDFVTQLRKKIVNGSLINDVFRFLITFPFVSEFPSVFTCLSAFVSPRVFYGKYFIWARIVEKHEV